MSWCDKLASTPAVGFTIDWHFATSSAILQAFSPILDKLVQDNKQMFTVERQEPFIVVFITNDGFQYSIEPSKIAVSFRHRLKVKHTSGGPPTMELLSRPLPFSKLLPNVSKRLIEATLLLPGTKTRTVTRIGIVSTTLVAEDEVPPGVARFIKYIGRPWKGSVDNFNVQIVADLDKTPKWSDRCVHLLEFVRKSSSSQTKLSEHEANRGEAEKSECVSGEIFKILGQAATAIEPSEGAFDDPPPW